MNQHQEKVRGTYTFHLQGRLAKSIIGCTMAMALALITAFLFIIWQAYVALVVPAIWAVMGIAFLLFGKTKFKEFITISPEGIMVLGVKQQIESNWVDTKQVERFSWTQVKNVEFTRFLGLNPTYLYINLLDGNKYFIDISRFNNSHRIIDRLREYVSCKDLGSSNANHHQCLR